MDEKPDQILSEIQSKRNELGANLNELETRVRQTADWRTHFDRHPMLMISTALGGGILLGAMVSGGKSKSRPSYSSGRSTGSTASQPAYSATSTSPAMTLQKQRASETIDHIKAALIGFATAKAKEFLNSALPGFDRHLGEVETRAGQRPSGADAYSGGQPGSYERSSEAYPGGNGPGGVTASYGQTGGYSQGGGSQYGSQGQSGQTGATNVNPL